MVDANLRLLGGIAPQQASNTLHVLAAMNHRQWVVWERQVLPLIGERPQTSAQDIVAMLTGGPLREVLRRQAAMTVGVVESMLGYMPLPIPPDVVFRRKVEQLTSWVAYAQQTHTKKLTRWLLLCRMPFLSLTPAQQLSDYNEARADL